VIFADNYRFLVDSDLSFMISYEQLK
jgi:hypothetical protein